MTAKQNDRRKFDIELVERLIILDERQQTVLKHLEKINGTIADYSVTKEKINNVCKDVDSINVDLDTNIKPKLTKFEIKLYTIAAIVGLITGGIGSGIGAAIVRFGLGG